MLKNKGRLIFSLLVIFPLIFFMFSGDQTANGSQEIKADILKQLKYRHIGPPGNRVSSVAGVPGDPNVYYAGNPAGGIHKTTDGGINWTPIFDDQQVPFIGSLAVAVSDSSIVWAGTGETWFRNNNKYLPIGNGVYKSTDGGKTWSHAGLEKTGRIGRIVIDPQDPDVVFVAAMGHCFGPQEERGVFSTKDGGKTWKRVLFVDQNTGCADIAMDPNNPRILFAGMWQTLAERSGGPGSGLYLSKDRGETWKKLSGHGLPDPPVGKIGIAIAPSNSQRIYALIETGGGFPRLGKEKTSSGVLWMSNDGGENWELVSYDLNMAGRTHYYTRCAVAPDDPDEIYFLAARLSISIDGGKSIESIGRELWGDHHDIWIDPSNADRIIESNDGGIGISVNRGKTWQQINLPNAQMYHVSVDNQIPYYVYGNLQDGPSHRGPSNSRFGRRGIPRGAWHAVGGSEAGFTYTDPEDNNIIWSTSHPGGALTRYDLRTGHTHQVNVWPESPLGLPDTELKYRFYRTYPIAISSHDHNKVYVGSQYVHQTTNGGNSWTIISPDLSTNDKSRQQNEGGLTPMNNSNEDCAIFALAESPLEEGLIWAGTNDGQMQVTRDGGALWTNVTSNIPDLPPWGAVSNIEPSRFDPGTCYITVTLHEENDRNPYVYKSNDYGKSWKSISSDLPQSDTYSCNARCIREDPVRQGLLYLGTENAIYVSLNDGANWLPLQTNLPPTPVHWLVVQEHFNDLVLGTHGRGFWILDDITPLQQLTPEVFNSEAYLFPPRQTYRFQNITAPVVQQGDPSVGENPPYGASINYYLKTAGTAQVKIAILDEKGQTIRTLDGTKDRGINRIWWNLRYELSKESRLRTRHLHAPWVVVGPQGWRPLPVRGGGRMVVKVPPGRYTVKLSVGENKFSQELIVKKDPYSAGSTEDIQAQTKLLLEIQDNIESVVEMINQIECLRKQIHNLKALLTEGKGVESIIVAGKELDKKLISVEDNLYQMRLTGRGQDNWDYRGPSKLISKLFVLVGSVNSADFAPTRQETEVHEILKSQLESYRNRFNEILENDLPAFNSLLKENNLPQLITVRIP